jgi:class 3 adenylate cyclase
VGFASWCELHAPEEIVPTLHQVFLEFEGLARAHGLDKLKTIGPQFMACAGILGTADDPLGSAIRAGLDMVSAGSRLVSGWLVRVGVNDGPVVAGIVGGERFQFDVWGNTVNVAARLTATAAPGVVALTAARAREVGGAFVMRRVGARALKGKGEVEVVEVPVQ